MMLEVHVFVVDVAVICDEWQRLVPLLSRRDPSLDTLSVAAAVVTMGWSRTFYKIVVLPVDGLRPRNVLNSTFEAAKKVSIW